MRAELATLRHEIAGAAGFPMVLLPRAMPGLGLRPRRERGGGLATRPDYARSYSADQAPSIVGPECAGYAGAYREYFSRHTPSAKEPKTMLDPAPRVILDDELGLACIGRSARGRRARSLFPYHRCHLEGGSARRLPGTFRAGTVRIRILGFGAGETEAGGKPPIFAGEIALVTGAASGIGRACVEALLKRGAAVVGLDIDPDVATFAGPRPLSGFAL